MAVITMEITVYVDDVGVDLNGYSHYQQTSL